MWKDQNKNLGKTWTPPNKVIEWCPAGCPHIGHPPPKKGQRSTLWQGQIQNGLKPKFLAVHTSPCSNFTLPRPTKKTMKNQRGAQILLQSAMVMIASLHWNQQEVRKKDLETGRSRSKDGWFQKIYRKSTFDGKVPLKILEDLRIKLQN